MANKRVSLKGKGADLFFGDYKTEDPAPMTDAPATQTATTNSHPEAPRPAKRRATRSTRQPTGQSTDESTNRATSQPAGQSTNQLTDVGNNRRPNKIVDRPKAFYITERLDARIDDAVRYFQQVHGLRKVDRSTVLNAMMDNDDQWTNERLDRLIDRLISQLTSRLTGR